LIRTLVLAGLLLAPLTAAVFFARHSSASQSVAQSQAESGSTGKRRRPEFVPGEVIVRFKSGRAFEGATQVALPAAAAQAAAKSDPAASAIQERIPVEVERFEGSSLVEGMRLARTAKEDTLKAVAALKARDDVLYAEPNYIRHADVTPNDPQFGQLYGLTKIGAPNAWNTTTGSSGIVVGVVDEGIDLNHPDLQANIWTNPAPGSIAGFGPKGIQLNSGSYTVVEGSGSLAVTVTRDPGDLHGFNFIGNNGIIPPELHATHVAGTIGAVGNNGVGVTGVNWQVGLMSLRFIDQATSNGSDADAIRAYNYAKQMRDLWVSSNHAQGANIRVLNNSYGGGAFSQAAMDAINALNQSNILFVAAAGNELKNNDVTPHFPSNYALPNVISVAATDSNDNLAGFSNFGAKSVLLGAPGVGIFSTTPNNTYGFLSGTSMATPHVSGAAALLLAQNQNLTPSQLRALLAFNGDTVASLQGKSITGKRLNVNGSLQALAENDNTAPGTVTSFQIASQNGRTINLSWNCSGDDGASGTASLYELSFIDQSTSAVFKLTSVVPSGPSGTAQNVSVTIPYRHPAGTIRLREFDNVGNEGVPANLTVNVDLLAADPYIPSTTANAALSSGGTAVGFNCDDCYMTQSLPFSFPYFGTNYSSIKISSNGNIYFEPPSPPTRAKGGDADDVPSSITGLSMFKMISGMWDDLDLRISRRADADVYIVQPDANRIIYRWQGVQFGDGVNGGPINFEIELNSNGVIKTRYGSGNTNLFPVVGISGGEPDVYVISALTSEQSPLSLTNAQTAVFTPRSVGPVPPPDGISSEASMPAPPPTAIPATSEPVVPVATEAAGDASVFLATSDTAGNQNCSVANGKASARCDYLTVVRTINFTGAENVRTVTIPIVDDSYAEGSETFNITLTNASGSTLGINSSATVTINDNDSSNGPNPSDLSSFFVRQHYLDFLNREPDTGGLNFWINNIESCAADNNCRQVKRIDTSAAFYLSIEFQQTGFLVERIHKAACGDNKAAMSTLGGPHMLSVPIVRFSEFLIDTQQIGNGVIVNQGNWQQILENNKVAFTQDFVQRSKFTSQFPPSTSPAAFVDKLNMNIGGVMSAQEIATAVGEFGGAADISNVAARARALRDVAENPTFAQDGGTEFRRSFVLMQYFGYLRRDPDSGQDTDYSGYDFWLTKLNQFNGDFRNAEMVKAFITSIEYRQRFGQ
jgi:subtilisin family serine protease